MGLTALAIRFQQYPQDAIATVVGWRVTESQDILATTEPDLDQLTQDRFPTRRPVPTTVNYTQAALAGSQ